jgi:hypothetical protein
MEDMVVIEFNATFCANPACPLHLRPGDHGVEGAGNWAELPCGAIVGRQAVDRRMFCDPCASRARGAASNPHGAEMAQDANASEAKERVSR